MPWKLLSALRVNGVPAGGGDTGAPFLGGGVEG
jgi:hypothetical protein